MSLLEKTVTALCEETARSLSFPPPYADEIRFVLRQLDNMPGFLSFPIRLATLGFSFTGVAFGGTLFHRLDPERRAGQVRAWRRSPLAPCRDLVRLYSSLILLMLYSRPAEAARAEGAR
jgi:hypothetical protein